MSASRNSLVTLLTRSLSLWVIGIWTATCLGVTWYVHQEVSESFDGALIESGYSLLELASQEIDKPGTDPRVAAAAPSPAPKSQATPWTRDHHLMYQIIQAGDNVIRRSAEAPEKALDLPRDEGFSTTDAWRVFTLRHPTQDLRIHVGDSLKHRQEVQREVLMWLLLPLIGLLPVLIFMVRRITRRALRPVAEFAAQVGRRGGSDLSAVPGNPLPLELQAIADSTNHLLSRLKLALDVERALAANAAHELRTPLATVRLRLATALEADLPAPVRPLIESAVVSLTQLSRRTEKLLQLSRAESSLALKRETVDLRALASAVAQEFWSDAAALVRLKLELTDDGTPQMLGDFDTLALALRNLIENALRYAPGARVVVEVSEPARIRVLDAGPGVSADKLQLLSARHVRQAQDQTGYGLGLSIVKTIVEKHGGTLTLASPPRGMDRGLEVTMGFPPARPPARGSETD